MAMKYFEILFIAMKFHNVYVIYKTTHMKPLHTLHYLKASKCKMYQEKNGNSPSWQWGQEAVAYGT